MKSVLSMSIVTFAVLLLLSPLESRAQCVVTAADAALSTPACSAVFDGRTYVIVELNGANWFTARAAAQALPARDGVGFDLVTITSSEEFAFVEALRASASTAILTQPQVWIGARQVTGTSGTGPEDWEWIKGEGTFPSSDCLGSPCTDTNGFADWAAGEPNNSGGSEDEVTLGRFASDPGYNDEGAAIGSIGGYIAETNAVPSDSCLEGPDSIPMGQVGGGGCNQTGSEINELPNQLAPELGGKFISSSFLTPIMTNAQCSGDAAFDIRLNPDGSVADERELDLCEIFDLTPIFGANNQCDKVVLPAQAVGTPCIAGIKSVTNFDWSDFADLIDSLGGLRALGNGGPNDEPEGPVMTITQDFESVPGLTYFSKVGPLSASQPDLQWVEQAGWQPTDKTNFVEEKVLIATSDVINPPRARKNSFSWDVLGLREACLDLDPVLTPEGTPGYFEAVLECKIQLAIDASDALEATLTRAAPNYNGNINKLKRFVNQWRSKIKNRQWSKALMSLQELRDAVLDGSWTITAENDPGNVIVRIDALRWRVSQMRDAEAL